MFAYVHKLMAADTTPVRVRCQASRTCGEVALAALDSESSFVPAMTVSAHDVTVSPSAAGLYLGTIGHDADSPLAIVPVLWKVVLSLTKGVVPPQLRSRFLHVAQRFAFGADPLVGRQVRLKGEVRSVHTKGARSTVVLEAEATASGVKVADATTVLLVRGALPPFYRSSSPSDAPSVAEVDAMTGAADKVAERRVAVDHDLCRRYAAAAEDRHPLHLDASVARAAGLADVILHGNCTLGLVSGEAGRAAGEDASRLQYLSARFAAPVVVPTTLDVEVHRAPALRGSSLLRFEARTGGRRALADGIATFRGSMTRRIT